MHNQIRKYSFPHFIAIILVGIIQTNTLLKGDETGVDKNLVTVSGYITDNKNEGLIGATIYVPSLKTGGVTNEYGFYSISLPKGEYKLNYSYMGYESVKKEIEFNKDKKIDVQLVPASRELESIEVYGQRKDANVTETQMSKVKLEMKEVKKIPALLGEVDVLKSIQLLPGITNSGEGSTGFYVRGGNVDQNLILLDGAPVYNPSHIGGFLSVFNSDAIKNIELYKGGIPARYGGRLSSVLDIRMNEGSTNEFHGSGGIGLPISSRLTFEGPIIKDKSSFILSGRRSYIDLFFPFSAQEAVQQSKVYFYDFNGKVNYKINDENRIFLSGYFGRDVARFDTLFGIDYGNKTLTARWNHIFNPRLFSNLTFMFSNFTYGLTQPTGPFAFDWSAGIIDYGMDYDYTFFLNPQNKIKFGLQAKIHQFKPGSGKPIGNESVFNQPPLDENYALENGLYVSNEQKINEWLSLSYGLRYSHYVNFGKDTIYNTAVENYQVVIDDTTYTSKDEFFSPYDGLEPRIGIRIKLNESTSLKASYNRMYQYIQMARNTTSATPLDLWFGTNPNIKPQKADQVALGVFKNFFDNQLETSLEAYYKKFSNAIDFKDHANLLLNKKFDAELRFGDGYSYGAELMIKKEFGRFNGWLAYTWSKTMWDIKLLHPQDYYLNGKEDYEYPASYDKPHDLSLTLSYDIKNNITLATNFVYASPMPTTVPTSKYKYNGELVPVYSRRNNVRIPGNEYHRLDLSLNWNFKNKLFNDQFEHGLNISVYNVYSRHNTYSVLFEQDEENPELTKATKIYLFEMIPSVTYNFNF